MKSDLLQESELKTLFDNGILKRVIIVNAPMQDGFMIMFEKTKGFYGIRIQRGVEPRLFKSIDGAVATCKKVGFRKMEVNLSFGE